MKQLFIYKGLRVRKIYLHIRGITFLILLLPFLLLNGLYFWKVYESLLLEPIKYGLIGALILILSMVFVFVLQTKLYRDSTFFGRLDNLRVLANFLVQHNYYLTKKKGQGQSIKLPKVYIKRDKYGLDATFILQGNKFQDKFLNIAKDLEVMFDGDFMAKSFVKGFVTYTIILGSISGRISVYDVQMTDKGLQLMSDVYWNFDEQPHLLVSGGTGGGKTVTLMTLIYGLSKIGWCDICDPKQSDFVGLKDVPVFHGRVYWTKEEMVQCLRDNVAFMNARYQAMTNHPEYSAGKRYSHYGMKPKFIIFDEWAAFIASLDSDYKLLAEVTDCLTQIILKGRQAGVIMILALQRPDGEFIKTALRDNFMKRLSVGHLEDTGYMMMYGDANRNKEFKKIDKINGKKVYGRGYISNGGEIAREFFSPYVPLEEGFSFLSEFNKLEPIPFEGEEFSIFSGIEEENQKSSVSLPTSDDLFEEQEEVPMFKKTLKNFAEEYGYPYSSLKKVVSMLKERSFEFAKEGSLTVVSEDQETILKGIMLEYEETGDSLQKAISRYFGE